MSSPPLARRGSLGIMRAKIGLTALLLSAPVLDAGSQVAQHAPAPRLEALETPPLAAGQRHGPPSAPGRGVQRRRRTAAASSARGCIARDRRPHRRRARGLHPGRGHLPDRLPHHHPVLAAIGQVESGNLAGHKLDAGHRVSPAILGPVLDGKKSARSPTPTPAPGTATPVWDRALGPMQIIPAELARRRPRHGRRRRPRPAEHLRLRRGRDGLPVRRRPRPRPPPRA